MPFSRTVGGALIGAAAAAVAVRMMPPIVAYGMGRLRNAAGEDVFANLIRDHREILSLVADMQEGAQMRRKLAFLRLKRTLAKHALAEEDVIYPMLHNESDGADRVKDLFWDHAQMKMALFALEQTPEDTPAWNDTAKGLADLLKRHIRDEEEVEFPRLRARLQGEEGARAFAAVQREKSLIL